jgi:intein/homing endonuclease
MKRSKDLIQVPSANSDRSPKAVAIQMPPYEPDEEFKIVPPQRKLIFDFDREEDRFTEVDAKIYEFNPVRNKYVIRHYRNKEAWKRRADSLHNVVTRVQETIHAVAKTKDGRQRLREAGLSLTGVEPDDVFSFGFDAAALALSRQEQGGWLNSEYLPMMIGPFCLVGETKIPLLNGTSRSLEELSRLWKIGRRDLWCYSCDCKQGTVMPGQIEWVGPTGRKECVAVTLDNGETIIASSDHPFLKRNGSYVHAANLKPGDRLMPLYRRRPLKRPDEANPREEVLHPGLRLWEPAAFMVARALMPRKYFDDTDLTEKRTWHIHHVDGNPHNNVPTNLQMLTLPEHVGLHRRSSEWRQTMVRRWADPEFRKKMAPIMKKAGRKAARTLKRKRREYPAFDQWLRNKISETHKRHAERQRQYKLAWWANPRNRARAIRNMRAADQRRKLINHVVVSVKRVGLRTVYDLQVARWHNFAVDAGVFVHNTRQLYLYDLLDMHRKCVVGSTAIPLLDGTAPAIEELAKREGPFWVYSYDGEKIVPAQATRAWYSGEKECVEVVLDNGESIIATHDHKFMLRDGRWMDARLLHPGDRLMPLYRRGNNYEDVYHPGLDMWEPTHKLVARNRHVHHVNGIQQSLKARGLNHIVVMVRNAGTHAVYDMAVPQFNCFAVGAGVIVHNSFEAYNHNPLARQAVRLISAFILGKGVTASCNKPEAQKVWDNFSNANNLPIRLRVWCEELSIFGELMLRWFPPLKPGASWRLRSIDPATVWEIVTEPDDIEKVYFYHQQYSTAYLLYTQPSLGPMKGVPSGIPTTRYIIRQIPAEEILHIKINVTSGEKRGRSDLFPVLGWLKRAKDFYTAEVVRAQGQASFMFDDTIAGGPADVTAHQVFLQNNPPQPGDIFAHNEAIKRTFVAATGRGPDLSAEGEAVVNIISVGMGLPKEYLGISMAGARATALVATEPAAKVFEDRQYRIEWMLHQIAQRLFVESGLPADTQIEFTFPSIAVEDRSAKLQDLALSESMGWMSHKTASTIAAKELLVTTFDYDEEMKKVKKELGGTVDPDNVIAQRFAMVQKLAPVGKGGGGGGPMVGPEGGASDVPNPATDPLANPGSPQTFGNETGDRATTRAQNNPLNPAGARFLRKDLSTAEATGDPDAKKGSAKGTPKMTKTTELQEAKLANFRPGYRTRWGKKVEAIITHAGSDMIAAFKDALTPVGEAQTPVTRSALIEFERAFEAAAIDKLAHYGSQAYSLGIAKGAAQFGEDQSTFERHVHAVGTWHAMLRSRVLALTNAMEKWWEQQRTGKLQEANGNNAEDDGDDEEDLPTVGDLTDRWEKFAMGVGLGLWTLYQAGFKEAITGGEVSDVQMNYIAVGDQDTCDPCAANAAGSPYDASEVPLPGDDCEGRDRCRCEIEVAG